MTDIDALVTGGTGFIGRWLLPELTAEGQRTAVLLRGSGDRLGELRSWVDAHGGRGDLVLGLSGDLAAPGLGLDAEDLAVARTARRVFHLGAAMSYGLAPEVAEKVNVRGSERVTALAASSPRLERLVLEADSSTAVPGVFRRIATTIPNWTPTPASACSPKLRASR